MGSSLFSSVHDHFDTYHSIVLSYLVSEILQVFCSETDRHSYSTPMFGVGVLPLDQIADVAKLIKLD